MIIDVCSFNGEHELWDLHYKALEDSVDTLVVCEWDTTFSGEPKPFYSDKIDRKKYPKAQFFLQKGNEFTEEEKLVAWNSPNTIGGAPHFVREFLQKESIKKALNHLNDSDLVFIGDVDEIWDKKALKIHSWPLKLKLDVYTYYLNNHSTEQFWGTLAAPYSLIKNATLNHLRTRAPKSKQLLGWHFTSMAHQLHKKLTDSYTQESYATPEVLNNLAYNIEHNRDFLGRDFQYELNESGWPKFLRENKQQYLGLCKQLTKNEQKTENEAN